MYVSCNMRFSRMIFFFSFSDVVKRSNSAGLLCRQRNRTNSTPRRVHEHNIIVRIYRCVINYYGSRVRLAITTMIRPWAIDTIGIASRYFFLIIVLERETGEQHRIRKIERDYFQFRTGCFFFFLFETDFISFVV